MADHSAFEEINLWAQKLESSHPELKPYLPELVDHVTSVLESAIAEGASVNDAFVRAIESVGEPSVLTSEFQAAEGPTVNLLGRSLPTCQAFKAVGATWVLLSLAWAAFVIVTKDETWMLVGWVFTTVIPLSALQARIEQSRRPTEH